MEYTDATYAVVESSTPFGVDITYTFDPFTNTLTTAWDFADLELDGTNPDVVITSDRDSSGFLFWEQASVGGTPDYRNDYQFDGYGRPVAVTQDSVAGGNTVEKKRVEFSYDLKSRLAAIERYLYETDGTTLDPVASSSYSCTDGELTGLVHSDPAEAILREYDWTYQAGQIVGETVDDDTRAFTYDAEGQLKTVTAVPPGGSTPVETEFVYDATGNREEIKEDNVQVADYEVDDFNRVTFDGVFHYDYDAEGNRVDRYVWTDADSDDTVDWNADEISNWTKYTWDHRNRLIRVESGAAYGTTDITITFGYDWLNRWISTDVDYASADDTSEYLVYGGATLPDEVAPWDRAAVDSRDIGQITLRLDETQKITNRYLWGPAVDQILADEQVDWNAGAQDYDIDQIPWPLTDHLGTVRDLAAVNGSGDTEIVNTYSYDAYGVLLAETDAGIHHLFGFTARPSQTDAGLINCLNRWYDPEVGTWITEDPISFQGGDANLYRYCGNDPVNSVDPGGLSERMGMHWVPRAVIGRFLHCLSREASQLFYSWTTDPWFYDHGSDPWGGVKHWQYNKAVETLLEARCRQLKPGEVLDEKAAREFIGWVLGTDKPETSILEAPGVKEALKNIRAYRRGFSQSVVAAFALKIQDPSLTREEIKVGVLALLNGKDSPKLSSKVLGAMRKVVQGGKPLLRYAAKWGLPAIGLVIATARGAQGSHNGHTGAVGISEEVLRDLAFAELAESIVFPSVVAGADGCGEIVGLGGFSEELREEYLKTYRWRRYGVIGD